MMKSTPPPLNLLPAFEASARLLSFKKAAMELNVTPSAISQQIKQLEAWFEEALFVRQNGRVTLTRIGEQYFTMVTGLLTHYQQDYQALYASINTPILRVSTMTQIAIDLLIPSVPSFQLKYPHVDLRIETSDEIHDFESDWIDAAIRVGYGDWPTLKSLKLCELTAVAAIAPNLISPPNSNQYQDLSHLKLIHSRTHTNDWQTVAAIIDEDLTHFQHIHFNNYYAATSAAVQGVGIVLLLLPLSQSLLDEGKLVRLNDQTHSLEQACYLTYHENFTTQKKFQYLTAWLSSVFATQL